MSDSYLVYGALGALALWLLVRASRKKDRSLARLESKHRAVMRQLTDASAEAEADARANAKSQAKATGNVVHVHVGDGRKRRRAPK